jgi:mannitol/fructose-specific phosphotransferase system IIA component (Ntr-type)
MKLRDFVVQDAIIPQLDATQRDDVVAELMDALIAAGAAPTDLRDTLIAEVLKREKNGSTGFGKGVAIPHVKHDQVQKVAAAIGVSQKGVDYNALDKQPVYCIFMLLSPAGQPDQHLHAMENIFANLQNDTFRSFLKQAADKDAVVTLLEEADNQEL